MRDFIRRFLCAIRTIPRRVRWMLIAPVAFIVLFWINCNLGGTIFFAMFGWLVVHELFQTSRRSPHGPHDDRRINPATGLRMRGLLDDSGNFYGCDDDLFGDHHD